MFLKSNMLYSDNFVFIEYISAEEIWVTKQTFRKFEPYIDSQFVINNCVFYS